MRGEGFSNRTNINSDDMLLCSACLCSTTAIHTGAGCFGCSGKSQFCCCEVQTCCKWGGNLGLSILCCEICPNCGCSCGDCCYNKCICSSCGLICPEACCLGQQHCCCCVSSCSLPCTDDVPCLCTLCPFLVLCPKNGGPVACCIKTGQAAGTTAMASQAPLLVQQTVVVQQHPPAQPQQPYDMDRNGMPTMQ